MAKLTGPEATKGKAKPKRTGTKARGESVHSPRRIESVEKQAQALEYRKQGLSYSQIAQRLGFNSPQVAWNAVESAIQRILREPAEAVRTIELERIDAMFLSVFEKACDGDPMAITPCLRLMERRAKLLGLDAPVKTELSGKDGGAIQTEAKYTLPAFRDAVKAALEDF